MAVVGVMEGSEEGIAVVGRMMEVEAEEGVMDGIVVARLSNWVGV